MQQHEKLFFKLKMNKLAGMKMKKWFCVASVLMILSAQANAAIGQFRILKNDSKQYTEESIRLETNKGKLVIYSVNLTKETYRKLSNLKKNQCISLTVPDQFHKHNGVYSIDNLKRLKIVNCNR